MSLIPPTFPAAQAAALAQWSGSVASHAALRSTILRDTRGDRWVAATYAQTSLALRCAYGNRHHRSLDHARTIARFAGLHVAREHDTRPPDPSLPAGLLHVAAAIETPHGNDWRATTRRAFAQHNPPETPAALAVDLDTLCTTLEALPAPHPGIHLAASLVDGSELLWTLQAVYALDTQHRAAPVTLAPSAHGLTLRGDDPERGPLWVATLPHYPARSAVLFDPDAPAVVVCYDCGRLAAQARTEGEALDRARAQRWVELDASDGPRWYCTADAPALEAHPRGTCAPDDDRDPYELTPRVELTRQRLRRRRDSGLTPAVSR